MFLRFGIDLNYEQWKNITTSTENVMIFWRISSLKVYRLCPSHFFSASDLSWDIMLYMKKVDLELISDKRLYLIFQRRTRGKNCYISKRLSTPNNKYLKSFDPEQESEHIYT